jgi:hypothetical protein
MSLLMAAVSAATCYAGTLAMSDMEATHPCCPEMPDACGGGQTPSVQQPNRSMPDCCVTPAADLASAAAQVAVVPSTDSVPLGEPALLQPMASQTVAKDAIASSSPPTYLLVSAFRI